MAKSAKSSKTVTMPRKQIKSLIKILQQNNKHLIQLQSVQDHRKLEKQIMSNKKQLSLLLLVLDRSQDLRDKINRKKEEKCVKKVETDGSQKINRMSKQSRRKTRKSIEKLTCKLENAFKEFGQ